MSLATHSAVPALPGGRGPVSPTHPTAVVEVNADGTASLHLGDSMAEHATHASRASVLRMLLDHAMTLGRNVTVLTRHFDGRAALHEIRPDGTMSRLRTPAPVLLGDQVTQRHHRGERPVRAAGAASHAPHVRPSRWSAVKRWVRRNGSLLIVVSILLVLLASIAILLAAALLWMRP